MKRIVMCIAAACAVIAMPALAQEQSSSVSVGVTGGTLGVGPEVSVRMAPALALRANATFFGINHTVDSSNVEYNGDAKLASAGAMVDLHPFENGFRLSAGARYNRNKVKVKATPGATEIVTIGGQDFLGAQVGSLDGTVKVKQFAPMLTLGYGGGLTKGIKFGVDAGVIFQGSPRIRNLSASGLAASALIPSTFNLSDALENEEREIEDDIDQYDLYPVLQLSVSYAF